MLESFHVFLDCCPPTSADPKVIPTVEMIFFFFVFRTETAYKASKGIHLLDLPGKRTTVTHMSKVSLQAELTRR